MSEVFAADFMRTAAFGGAAAALALGILGVYIVLRRVVFVGLALANVATLGAAIAVTLGWRYEVTIVGAAIAAAVALALSATPRRVPAESLVGWGYAAAAGATVLILARSAPDTIQVMGLVFGTVLAVRWSEAWMLAAIALAVLAVHLVLGKRLTLVVFDSETAQAAGVRTTWWTVFLYLLVGVATAAGLRATGTLLAFSLLTLPAMAALLVTRSLVATFALSAAVAVASVLAGLAMSFQWDLPTGPLTVVLLAAVVAVAQLVERVRR
jgi:ABC-type Mn2+/Zn2+ transport system permease subunit